MHSHLPRELRDLVYDYLWTEEQVDEMDIRLSSTYTTSGLDSRYTEGRPLPVPFFADATLIGKECAEEAAIWYFRKLTQSEVHYRCVRAYLNRDSFGAMPLRVRDMIRRLVIAIDWKLGDEIDYESLRDNMNSLLALKDHKDLTIEIYLDRKLQWSRMLFHTLDTIRPVFEILHQTSVTFKVLGDGFFSPGCSGYLRTLKGEAFETSEQLNYYFAGTPQDWLAMKVDEIGSEPKVWRRDKCFEV